MITTNLSSPSCLSTPFPDLTRTVAGRRGTRITGWMDWLATGKGKGNELVLYVCWKRRKNVARPDDSLILVHVLPRHIVHVLLRITEPPVCPVPPNKSFVMIASVSPPESSCNNNFDGSTIFMGENKRI